jgi:hypothetical protein
MFITKDHDQNCCTCNHWMGTRVLEEGGYIYSLEDLEGICSGVRRVVDGAEFNRALTFPGTHCNAWCKWGDLQESPQDRLAA